MGDSAATMTRNPLLLLRSLCLWVLLAPFLVQSLVSAHVMPGRAADGSLVLVLCTEEGPVELAIDPATGEPASPVQAVGGLCDWACGQMAAADVSQSHAPVLRRIAMVQPPPRPVARTLPDATCSHPPARGPPLAV